jgi:adenosine deaminase
MSDEIDILTEQRNNHLNRLLKEREEHEREIEQLSHRASYLQAELNLMRRVMQHEGTWEDFCSAYAEYKRARGFDYTEPELEPDERCGSLFPGGHGETRTCQIARGHSGAHVYRRRQGPFPTTEGGP